MKNYLFVAGCARSGTSALAQLLSGSQDIVIGMERYGHLVQPDDFRLNESHFTKERFFEMKDGDTFYEDFDKFHKFDANLEKKFDDCKWIGDKRPDLYESYDQLFKAFPSCTLIFIYRNLEDVASSYQARIKKGENWPASKDFKAAVREWNRSLYLTREALKKGYNIKVVDYDSIFCSDKKIDPIFNCLGLNMDEGIDQKVREIRERSSQLVTERKSYLSKVELDYIENNAKKFLINDLGAKLI
ncbi:sulfotransferase family protein [Vibrio nereis]|uniref:sulfotransferase family protein n=1 Tax=Vibrio nereis TaxID=693 RepID=UPI002495144B|nr:sulfotransferase [Vibrio nereis]